MNRKRAVLNRSCRPLRTIFLTLVALMGGSACGDAVVGREGDTDASVELTVCQRAAESLCTQACDCQSGNRCFTVYGDGVATTEFDDFDHCRTFTAFTCNGDEESEVQTCIDQLATENCTSETHDGESVQALPIPIECTNVNI